MNKFERQIVAEKISSTIRVLELLELEYEVSSPRQNRKKPNRSPRVVIVKTGKSEIAVYNGTNGQTWASDAKGNIPGVKTIEDLYDYLSKLK